MSQPSRGIDRDSDRALWRQLADLLYDQIRTGELRVDDELPSIAQLCDTYGLGKRTVEDALAELKRKGLIILERGRRARVRPSPMTSQERYTAAQNNYRPDQESTFAEHHGVPWSAFQLDRLYERDIPAPPEIATALAIPAGTPMVRRRWVHAHDGVALRIAWSYLEQAKFGDTILCDPDEPPWPGGTMAQLRHLGHRPVTEPPTIVRCRPGTDEECELLGVEPGTFMQVSLRTHCELGSQFNTIHLLEAAIHVTPYWLGELKFNMHPLRSWNLYG